MKSIINKQARIPVRLPKQLQDELGKSVLNNNYGFKGRSKWVEEAIEQLLTKTDFCQFSILDDTFNAPLVADSFNITQRIRDSLEEALITIKKTEPKVAVTISSIVRTAIIQRMLRDTVHPVDNHILAEEFL